MANFKKLFEPGDDPEKWPDTVKYKGKTIFLSDKFPVRNKETLIFSIESTKSNYPQGFCVRVFDGYLKTNGESMPRRKKATVLFWEDSEILNVKNIQIQVVTKQGYIFIKNIWEIDVFGYVGCRQKESGEIESGFIKYDESKKEACYYGGDQWLMDRGNGAAMYSEDIEDGKRYFCNDGDLDNDFDDIIFTVKRL